MRILAASFMTLASATKALDALNRQFGTEDDVRLAPLGRAGGPGGPTMVLAGRFADDVVEAVRRAVKKFGGTVVVDADDRATGNA
jgi:hypothetical protein